MYNVQSDDEGILPSHGGMRKGKHKQMGNSGRNDLTKNRITVFIIATVMLMAVVFSAFFIAAHADHDCAGEDCPICAVIHQCESMLRGIGDGAGAEAVAIVPVFALLVCLSLITYIFTGDTPVSRKVRLNN